MTAIERLIKALEAGVSSPGSPLVIESLRPMMKHVVFRTDYPDRIVDGLRRPVVSIWGRLYEFEFETKTQRWVQVKRPSAKVGNDDRHLFTLGGYRRISRKRLTAYQVKKANRDISTFLARHA